MLFFRCYWLFISGVFVMFLVVNGGRFVLLKVMWLMMDCSLVVVMVLVIVFVLFVLFMCFIMLVVILNSVCINLIGWVYCLLVVVV